MTFILPTLTRTKEKDTLVIISDRTYVTLNVFLNLQRNGGRQLYGLTMADKKATHNSTFAIGGVPCSVDSFVVT